MMNTQVNSQAGSRNAIHTLVINALGIALVFVATMFINIRLPFAPNGGLIHLGNVPLFIFAVLFGRKTGFLAGAFGMGLFDLISGWTAWAPFTFVICGAIGYVVGLVAEHNPENKFGWLLCSLVLALLIKIGGYYVAEAIIYSNWIVPASSIPGNVLQITAAAVVAAPVAYKLKSILKR